MEEKIMANEVTKLIMETILGLITTAFAFVAGLAWNDAIQKLIEQFIGTGDALPSLFIYAIVVTVVAVIVTVLLARVAGKMGIDLDD
jgi:cation transporter-like permease